MGMSKAIDVAPRALVLAAVTFAVALALVGAGAASRRLLWLQACHGPSLVR